MNTPFDFQSIHTVRELQDAYDGKKVTVVEAIEHFLERSRQSELNAWITLSEDSARLAAREAQAFLDGAGRVPRETHPLWGVPVGIKDNLVTEGIRTTCASRILENYIPPYSATVVTKMQKAGAIVLGKLNMDEFGMGGSNENSAFGPVRHPTHPERVPGGSSGGAAAAVRAGLCWAALGTDTGGSIRLPASFCGVVGLKPSYGSVSRYGLVAFASSLDQAGPLTRSVEDSALIFDVIAGEDPKDSTSCRRAVPRSSDQVRVGVPDGFLSSGVNKDVKNGIEKILDRFTAQGVRVCPIEMPHLKYAVSVYYVVAVSEASSNLSRYDGIRYGVRPREADETQDLEIYYQKVRSLFGPEVKRRILLGTFALSSGYSEAYYRRACQVRQLIRRDFDEAFEKVDFLIGPVAPSTAFRLGEKIQDPLKMYLNDMFTIPASLAGIPALSLPCGEDSSGLPIGLQVMGRQFSEGQLLQFARGIEKGICGGTV